MTYIHNTCYTHIYNKCFGSNTDHALVLLYTDEVAPSAAPPSEDDKPNCTYSK